jgi:hypothetical protein
MNDTQGNGQGRLHMMRLVRWIACGVSLGGVAAIAASAGGCTIDPDPVTVHADGGSSTTNILGADATSGGQACTPGTKQCANDHVAQVCPTDGVAWVEQNCAANQKCPTTPHSARPAKVPASTPPRR